MRLVALLTLATASLLSFSALAEPSQTITIRPGQSAQIDTGSSQILVACEGEGRPKAIKCQCYFGFTHVGEVVGTPISDFNQLCKDGTGFSSAQAQGCREI